MTEEQARRKIATLTAVVQVMIREVYCGSGPERGRALFDLQLDDDELLAMAIANELDEQALSKAFSDFAGGAIAAGGEVAASPLAPVLNDEQLLRARVALLGHTEADHAHTLAVRAPEEPGTPGRSTDERIRLAEETFIGRMEIDALHACDGWSGFSERVPADGQQRIAQLPEPWRRHAKKRLPELRERICQTLARRQLEGPARG